MAALPIPARSAHLITRTHTDTTIQLSQAQYRELADLCKEHAGKPLNLTSVKDMEGDWGRVNYWALPTLEDVTLPDQRYRERAYVYLVDQLSTGAVRAAGRRRPECDWSVLRNSEIYSFIVWHEIGHFRDNFHPFDLFAKDGPNLTALRHKLAMANEVLADRFAWERVRPGEPLPLTEAGRKNAEAIERDIEMLDRVIPRAKYKHTPLETGQYRHVPAYMLYSKRKAAYVGPDIDPTLLAREIKYYRAYFEKYGRHMHGVA
jgi:hypothetical protein